MAQTETTPPRAPTVEELPTSNLHKKPVVGFGQDDHYPHWTVKSCLEQGGCWYDAAEAYRAIRFIESQVYHLKGDLHKKPLVLEEWQREIVRMLVGIKLDGTNLRRFREASIWLPRKQGKTTLVAALGIYLLGWAGEMGGEVALGASTRKQANILFDFVRFNIDEFVSYPNKFCVTRAHKIYHTPSLSTLETVSSEAGGIHGSNPSVAIIDELHKHPNNEVYEALESGQGTRSQPLLVTLSTAGVTGTFAHGMFKSAERCLRGMSDRYDLLPVIYGLGAHQDPLDPKNWLEMAPNNGVSVTEDYLKGKAIKARESASYYNTFLNLYANYWVSATSAWMQPHVWNKAARSNIGLKKHAGRYKAWLGIDLSSTEDLTAISVIVEVDDGTLELYTIGYIPESKLEDKRKNEIPDIHEYRRKGSLIVCSGEVVDFDAVKNDIIDLMDYYDFQQVAYDPWGAKAFAIGLGELGLKVDALSCGFSGISEPVKQFEASLKSGRLVHEGDGLMEWFISNTVKEKNGNEQVRLSKTKSRNKIDGSISAVVAFGAWLSQHYTPKAKQSYLLDD